MRQVRCILRWAFFIYPYSVLFLEDSCSTACASPSTLSFLSCSSSIPPWRSEVFSFPCGPFFGSLWCSRWVRCAVVLCRRRFSCAFITSPCAAGSKHHYYINEGTLGCTQGTGPRLHILHLRNVRTILMPRQNSLGSVSLHFFLVWISQEWVMLFGGPPAFPPMI